MTRTQRIPQNIAHLAAMEMKKVIENPRTWAGNAEKTYVREIGKRDDMYITTIMVNPLKQEFTIDVKRYEKR